MKKKNLTLTIVFSLLLIFVVSCGGEENNETILTAEDCKKEGKVLSEDGKKCVEPVTPVNPTAADCEKEGKVLSEDGKKCVDPVAPVNPTAADCEKEDKILSEDGKKCVEPEPQANPAAFITIWKTDNKGVSEDNQIKITTEGDGYDYNIDCDNDGILEAENQKGDYTCNYAAAGTYTVKITGAFPRIFFDHPYDNTHDNEKILSVEQWGGGKWSSMKQAFFQCSNLEVNAKDSPDLSNVSDMSQMFHGAISFNQDISNWDVSNVVNIFSMFHGATNFNQDIGNWDVSNVAIMNKMFSGATNFNQDISNWDVSNVVNMFSMFDGATNFNQDIGGWLVNNVTDMSGMFHEAKAFNQDISKWHVNNVTNMYLMFYGAESFNQDISNWDVSSVTNMDEMFGFATSFDQDISNWDVSNVASMFSMFAEIKLSTKNYDAILSDWSKLNLKEHIQFNGGKSTYCESEAARKKIMDDFGWEIIDGGKGCEN